MWSIWSMGSAAQAQTLKVLKVILSLDKVNNAIFVECEAYYYRQRRPIWRFRKQCILYMKLRQKFRPSVVCKFLIQGTHLFYDLALPLCVQEWNHELPVSWCPGTSSARDSDASGASAATNSIPADGALLAFLSLVLPFHAERRPGFWAMTCATILITAGPMLKRKAFLTFKVESLGSFESSSCMHDFIMTD